MGIQFKQWLDRFLGIMLILPNVFLARLLGIILRRNHNLDKAPANIIFVKILGLGSLVMAADAIGALRERYPNTRFILLCHSGLVEGLRPAGLFDEFWELEDRSFYRLGLSALSALVKSWRLSGLWTVDLEIYSKLTTVFTLWTMAINRIGFQLKTTHFRNFLNTHNEYFNPFCSVEENYRQLIKRMGVETEGAHVFPGMEPENRKDEGNKPYVAINNTCSELAYVRKLPDDKLTGITWWLLENTSYKLALCGAPDDYQQNQDFIGGHFSGYASKGRIVNLAGKYKMAGFFKFLHEQCAFMVSVDSAPLHIARKLGLPTVSVWGPTNPVNYLDIQEKEKHRHLHHYLGVHCSPCIHHSLVLPCGGNNFCMKNMEISHLTYHLKTVINQLEPRAHV